MATKSKPHSEDRRKHPKASNLKRALAKILDRRLVAYSAAAELILAGGAAANAAIVHTDISDVTLTMSTSYDVDFDSDGVIDTRIGILKYSIHVGPANSAGRNWSDVNKFKNVLYGWGGVNGSAWTMTSGLIPHGRSGAHPNAVALNSGSAVGGSNWKQLAFPAEYLYWKWRASSGGTPWTIKSSWGSFNDTTDKYMGLKFKIGPDMHYGWVQIDVNRTVTQAVIKGYAYQTIPIGQGGTLTAGQTASASVPEPSGLALLALGAAGIAARRRRKQR